MATETLTMIVNPVTEIRLGNKRIPFSGNDNEAEDMLRANGAYRLELVGTTLCAVRLTKARCTDRSSPYFGRICYDNETARVKLASLTEKVLAGK